MTSKKSKRRRGPSKPQGMTYMDTVSTSAKMHDDWIEAEVQRRLKQRVRNLQQICIDSAFFAANDEFHMGPSRCYGFGQSMVQYIHEIAELLVEDARHDPEAVYAKAKVDERMQKICGDKFQPWEERYNGEREA